MTTTSPEDSDDDDIPSLSDSSSSSQDCSASEWDESDEEEDEVSEDGTAAVPAAVPSNWFTNSDECEPRGSTYQEMEAQSIVDLESQNPGKQRDENLECFQSHQWGDAMPLVEGMSIRDIMLLCAVEPVSVRYEHKQEDDYPDCASMTQYLLNRHDRRYEDICEIFGGAGGVLRMGVRRKLQGSKNFDLTCGIDLTQQHEVDALFRYLKESRVFCVIMGPPCTAFGPWRHVNASRYRSHESRARARQTLRVGTELANLSAKIAMFQLSNGRHFIAENPHTSALWKLPSWRKVLSRDGVVRVVCDQCMKGLMTPYGTAKKPTSFVASHEKLVRRLRVRCDHSHRHIQLEGSLTKPAQQWSQQLCRDIVDGVLELKLRENRNKRKRVKRIMANIASFSPALHHNSQETDRRPAANAAGPVIMYPVDVSGCIGCTRHRRQDDIEHNRIKGLCKFAGKEPKTYSCPGCVMRRKRGDDMHNLIVDECQWATAGHRGEHQRPEAKGPREPRLPAATEPTIHQRSTPVRGEMPMASSSSSSAAAPPLAPVVDEDEQGKVVEPEPASAERDAEDRQRAVEPAEPPVPYQESDWSSWDLGTSMPALRSNSDALKRRTIRMLHVRWFHASSERMTAIFKAAGVPASTIDMVQPIVAHCRHLLNMQTVGEVGKETDC